MNTARGRSPIGALALFTCVGVLAASPALHGCQSSSSELVGTVRQAASATLTPSCSDTPCTPASNIIVAFQGMPGNAGDWISIGLASEPTNQYLSRQLTGGAVSGVLFFPGLPAGAGLVVRAWAGGSNQQISADIATSLPLDPLSSASTHAAPGMDVLTQRVDTGRTGATQRAGFNAAALQQSHWGFLTALQVDGVVWAQPLYVQNVVQTKDGAAHDMILVATAMNTVYAFDADTFAPLWGSPVQLGTPDTTTPGSNSQPTCVTPDGQLCGRGIGILSTPVVDRTRGWLDVSYRITKGSGAEQHAEQHLGALSLADGSLQHDYTITNGAMVSDNHGGWNCSTDSSGAPNNLCGHIDGVRQRASLLLANNIIYMAFSLQQEGFWLWPGPNNDLLARGQVLAFDAATMNFLGSWTSVSGSNTRMGGGIWQASVGLASDASGDVYLATGNAMSYVASPTQPTNNPPFVDPEEDPNDNPFPADYVPAPGSYGNAVVRLHATPNGSGGITLAPPSPTSFFIPSRSYWHNIEDIDLGSAGPMLVPGTNMLIHGGKEAVLYVLQRDQMGGFVAGNYMTESDYLAWPLAPSDPVSICEMTRYVDNNHPRFFPTTPAKEIGPVQSLQLGFNYDIPNPVVNCWNDFPHVHGTPTFGQFSPALSYIYVWPEKDFLKALPWTTSSSLPLGNPVATSDGVAPLTNGMPGGMLALSVDPSTQGGVLFANTPLDVGAGPLPKGTLRAFNPIPVNGRLQQIWTDFETPPYTFAKFVPPTIARDYAFQATWSNEILVYGPTSTKIPFEPTQPFAGLGIAAQDANQAQTVAGFIGSDGALHVIWKGDQLDWDPSRSAQVTAPSIAWPGAPVTIVSSGNAVHAVFGDTHGAIHWVSRVVPSAWIDHGAISPAVVTSASRLGALVDGAALDVFLVQSDNAMHVWSGTHAPFSSSVIGAGASFSPSANVAAIANGTGELDVFAVDSIGTLRRIVGQPGRAWTAGSKTIGTNFFSGGNLAAATYLTGTGGTSTLGVFGVDASDALRGFTSTDGGQTFHATAFTVAGYAPAGASVAVGTFQDPNGNNHASLYVVGHAGALDAFVLEALPKTPTGAINPGNFNSTPAMFAHTGSFGIGGAGALVASWGNDVIVTGRNGLFTLSNAQWDSVNKGMINRTNWFPTALGFAAPPPPTSVAPALDTVPAPGAVLPLQKWVSGDFNGDHLTDLANIWCTVEGGAIGIDVYLDQGNGTFLPQPQWGKIGSTGAFFSTAKWVVGDYNQDGRPDLATAWSTVEGGAIGIDVYLNMGDHFQFEPNWVAPGAGGAFFNSEKWMSGDFNHDGVDDLAVAWSTVDFGQIGIDVYTSDRVGHFAAHPQWGQVGTQGIFTASQFWFSGDFDHDGWPDLADVWDDVDAKGVPQNVIDVHLNSQQSSFVGSPQWGQPETQGVFDPNDKWVVGDFNDDGYPDLASAFSDDNSGFVSLDVHLNTKSKGFTAQRWATLLGPYNGASGQVFTSWPIANVGFDMAQSWFAGNFHGSSATGFAYVYNSGGAVPPPGLGFIGIGELSRLHSGNGASCLSMSDCASFVCTSGTCQPPQCATQPGACGQNSPCGAASDCGSGVCAGGFCQPALCAPKCSDGQACGNADDCASFMCSSGVCQPPNCATQPTRCNQNSQCGAPGDCGSLVCTNGLCQPPACSPNCATGKACNNSGDCSSHTCTAAQCM